jgi:hypothetical protein
MYARTRAHRSISAVLHSVSSPDFVWSTVNSQVRRDIDDLLPIKLKSHPDLVDSSFDLPFKYQPYKQFFDFFDRYIQLLWFGQ